MTFRPLVVVFALLAVPALARDWFVREGSSGNGSQAKPFGDPWEALAACESGDRIHVAAGKYFGRLEGGTWKLPFPRLQLFGGYDRDFKTRDPWKNLTELTFKTGSKNKPGGTSRITGGDDYSGGRIDGFVIDMDSQNEHNEDGSLDQRFSQPTPLMIDQPGFVLANNIIVNSSSGLGAVSIRPGVTLENNLIVNSVAYGVKVTTGTTLSRDTNKEPPVIRNNTIAFTWDPNEAGTGGPRGAAIWLVAGTVVIDGNLIMNADNQGVTIQGAKPEEISLKNNTFFQNLFANVKVMSVVPAIIDDDTMDGLDELGFKSQSNNEVKNPKAKLPKEWLELFSRRQGSKPGQVKMDDWNELRRTMGLPVIATGGTPYTGFAPPWKVKDALALLDITAVKSGARRKTLTVDAFSEAGPAVVQRDYVASSVEAWANTPDAMAGRPVVMTVGLGQPTGIQYMKVDGVSIDTHEGTYLTDVKGETRIIGVFKKGSGISRTIEGQATKRLSTSGKPPALFIVKGVIAASGMVPKGAVILDSFDEQDLSAVSASARPKGRDWFVRAGAKNGDGTKEKPFKDPYQALEKVETGDSVHVAEGEYSGKLRAGKWVIDMPFIALLGGYDADFKERDPWKHPTLLRFIRDDKNSYGQGYIVEGALDHRGALVDGFVFDRRDYNLYGGNGDLMVDRSNRSEALWLNSPGSAVRNCVFVNGAAQAVRMGSATIVENNIFMNFVTGVVTVQRGDDNTPALIRNNTILFGWNEKFGEGTVTTGWGVKLDTQARGVVDNNIIAFIDNHGVEVFGDPGDVSITNNVFSHNLWSNYETSPARNFIDDTTMNQFSATGLKASSGNVVQSVDVVFDAKWFDVYTNRTAPVPGKVAMDDWNQLRSIMGLNLIATGGKAGTGFAPMYDWKKAMELFPKKPLKQGAHKVPLTVKFDGITRQEPNFTWEDTTFDVLMNNASSLAGQRVSVRVAVRGEDNKYLTPGIDQTTFASFMMMPVGEYGRGKNAYVPRGTRFERTIRNAKSLGAGEKPVEVFVVKGVVQQNGDVLADVVIKEE